MNHVDPSRSSSSSPPLTTAPAWARLRALRGFHRIGTSAFGENHIAQCPAHEDDRESLSISVMKDGKILLNCFAGCETAGVCIAMNIEMKDLFPSAVKRTTPRAPGEPVAVYEYLDADETLLYQALRYEPKAFSQRRPDENGGWITKDVFAEVPERVLYRLPALIAKRHKALCWTEGEKDVQSLEAIGLAATTTAGGSAQKWRPEYGDQLHEVGVERLVIFPDNDAPGMKYAQRIAAEAHALDISVRIVALPGLGDKQDVTDWLAVPGNTRERLVEIVKNTPAWQPVPLADVVEESAPAGATELEGMTDVAFARMLVSFAKQRIRYCEAKACWYVYDGRRWGQGSANLVKPFVHEMARMIDAAVVEEKDTDERALLRKAATKLESHRVIMNVIGQAMAMPEIQIDPTAFDQHPDLLNTINGTIDLRTGKLRDHDPDDLLSLITPVEYRPTAQSDLWDRTLSLAMEDDAEMLEFLQRMYGYILTGSQAEKKFFDEFGPKDTGKTSINDTFAAALGEYAKPLRVEALQKTREPDKIPHELAALQGRRLALVSEVPPGTHLNEALLKRCSGGEKLSVSFKYGHPFDYRPQFTLVMYSNDRIQLSGTDEAIWIRAMSVPFRCDFRALETHDPDAREKLKQPEHLEAVLAWAVAGAVTWYAQSLAPIPDKVVQDTEDHRAEVGAVETFLSEECVLGPMPGNKVPAQTFHRAYNAWAVKGGHGKIAWAALEAEMVRLGHHIQTIKTAQRNEVDGYVGVGLADVVR